MARGTEYTYTDQRRPEEVELANMWAGSSCTLDGRPATIGGRLNRFATVGTLSEPHLSVDFSWSAVDRIMRVSDGQFGEKPKDRIDRIMELESMVKQRDEALGIARREINRLLALVQQVGSAFRGEPPEAIDTEEILYEPWADGHSVGFLCTHKKSGEVEYIYLAPSRDGYTPDVFLYQDAEGGYTGPQHWYSVHADQYPHEETNS